MMIRELMCQVSTSAVTRSVTAPIQKRHLCHKMRHASRSTPRRRRAHQHVGLRMSETHKVTIKVTTSPEGQGKAASGGDFKFRKREATTGFEPVIAVLQTAALPLGYVADG